MFKDRKDVEEWLEPLDYEGFWSEVGVFDPDIEPRDICDQDIAAGVVDEATVLEVLKRAVRLELVRRFSLPPRDRMPWHSLH